MNWGISCWDIHTGKSESAPGSYLVHRKPVPIPPGAEVTYCIDLNGPRKAWCWLGQFFKCLTGPVFLRGLQEAKTGTTSVISLSVLHTWLTLTLSSQLHTLYILDLLLTLRFTHKPKKLLSQATVLLRSVLSILTGCGFPAGGILRQLWFHLSFNWTSQVLNLGLSACQADVLMMSHSPSPEHFCLWNLLSN